MRNLTGLLIVCASIKSQRVVDILLFLQKLWVFLQDIPVILHIQKLSIVIGSVY